MGRAEGKEVGDDEGIGVGSNDGVFVGSGVGTGDGGGIIVKVSLVSYSVTVWLPSVTKASMQNVKLPVPKFHETCCEPELKK